MLYLKTLIIVVQLLSALGVIGLVLLQHGKGADMGAAFGSGASGSLFGATGSANFFVAYHGRARSRVFCNDIDAYLPWRVSRKTVGRLAGHGCDRSGCGVCSVCAGRWFGRHAGVGCVRPGDRCAEINFSFKVLLCVEQTV